MVIVLQEGPNEVCTNSKQLAVLLTKPALVEGGKFLLKMGVSITKDVINFAWWRSLVIVILPGRDLVESYLAKILPGCGELWDLKFLLPFSYHLTREFSSLRRAVAAELTSRREKDERMHRHRYSERLLENS
ncbi:hypothetical protein AVEN_168687-1 [Araneus ventricosus]|uniref:Uncharacterized protein n=1 Tax=Araneus ventricosus TaxID=182803 RepID=A0A4Y2M217_ARAVE|nr:hypothetical protein AVEN_168687-1 [Araneus ventricosus]